MLSDATIKIYIQQSKWYKYPLHYCISLSMQRQPRLCLLDGSEAVLQSGLYPWVCSRVELYEF